MSKHLANDAAAKAIAQAWCLKNECRYLSHEYYYHSNGSWNKLHIAVEDGSGRSEVIVDLNKENAA